MAKSAVFLSGWEYNRLLADDPFVPLNSGIPAEVLWNGSSQFWLFEKVYCTKEAFHGDFIANDALGWTTGLIFEDLKTEKILEVVDLEAKTKEDTFTRLEMLDAHRRLKERYPEPVLRNLITIGDETTLEAIKCELLAPLFRRLACVKNVSPSSLKNWIGPRETAEASGQQAVHSHNQILQLLASSVKPWKLGSSLCNRPGTGLSDEVRTRQAEVEKTLQAPMIPDLLLSKLSHEDYMRVLRPTRDVYEPISKQLYSDYKVGRERLLRLRDFAASHLWRDLHQDWLPNLEANPSYIVEFEQNLRRATSAASMGPLFDILSIGGISFMSAFIGAAIAEFAGASGFKTTLAGAAGAITGTTLKAMLDKHREESGRDIRNLTLFLQKANRV